MSWRTQAGWMKRRACRGMDPGPWFSKKPEDEARARAVCADCPVRVVCLSWQLEYEGVLRQVDHGIFGGVTPAERREMLGLTPPEPPPTRRPALTPERSAEMRGMTATKVLMALEASHDARNPLLRPGCGVEA